MTTLAGGLVAGGTLAGAIGASMIGSAVGSIASQVVGMATGNVQEFSWGAVATSALTAGITAGVGGALGATGGIAGQITGNASSTAMSNVLLNGAINNAIGQGVNMLTGQQKKFSWVSVAAGAVAGAVGGGMQKMGLTGGGFIGDFGRRAVTGAAYQVVANQGKIDWTAVAADAFGNALGNAVVAEVRLQSIPPKIENMGGKALDVYKDAIRNGMLDRDAERFASKVNAAETLHANVNEKFNKYKRTDGSWDIEGLTREAEAPLRRPDRNYNGSSGVLLASADSALPLMLGDVPEYSFDLTGSGGTASTQPLQIAWSSLGGVLGAHQESIDRYLPELPKETRDAYKEAQVVADVFQDEKDSYTHSMREPGADITDELAKLKANLYVREAMNAAWAQPDPNMSTLYVGLAMHALQDATSPSHRSVTDGKLITWHNGVGPLEFLQHASKELFFSQTGTNNESATRAVHAMYQYGNVPAGNLFDYFGVDGVGAYSTPKLQLPQIAPSTYSRPMMAASVGFGSSG